METNKGDAKNIIASDLLSYLAENPQAQDTLEGIAKWWLLEQEITRRVTEVRSALDGLVSGGFIIEVKGKDGRSRYRLNQGKQDKVELKLNIQTDKDE